MWKIKFSHFIPDEIVFWGLSRHTVIINTNCGSIDEIETFFQVYHKDLLIIWIDFMKSEPKINSGIRARLRCQFFRKEIPSFFSIWDSNKNDSGMRLISEEIGHFWQNDII